MIANDFSISVYDSGPEMEKGCPAVILPIELGTIHVDLGNGKFFEFLFRWNALFIPSSQFVVAVDSSVNVEGLAF